MMRRTLTAFSFMASLVATALAVAVATPAVL